jgi:hypothetical protein
VPELRGRLAGAIPGPVARNEFGDIPPEEIPVRAQLALRIYQAGELDLAKAELDKILMLQPDHIAARMMRVELAIETRRFDAAQRDFDAVLNHPRLVDYLRDNPNPFVPFYNISRLYLCAEMLPEARRVARAALDFSIFLKKDCGRSHFYLARVEAVAARTDPGLIEGASNQLFKAFQAHRDFQRWYQREDWFDPVRIAMDAELRRLASLDEARRRPASALVAQKR